MRIGFLASLSARGLALLILAFPVLFAVHIKAAVDVVYSAGPFPGAMAFDGTNIWIVNGTSHYCDYQANISLIGRASNS
jgi:hypothetical protein